MFHLLTAARVD